MGWAGAFHRSALVALDVSGLGLDAKDLAVIIGRDKTDQEGGWRVLAIPFSSCADVCAVRTVRAWLDAVGISEGPMIPAVNRHGRVGAVRLSDRAVALVGLRAAASLGLDVPTFAGPAVRPR